MGTAASSPHPGEREWGNGPIPPPPSFDSGVGPGVDAARGMTTELSARDSDPLPHHGSRFPAATAANVDAYADAAAHPSGAEVSDLDSGDEEEEDDDDSDSDSAAMPPLEPVIDDDDDGDDGMGCQGREYDYGEGGGGMGGRIRRRRRRRQNWGSEAGGVPVHIWGNFRRRTRRRGPSLAPLLAGGVRIEGSVLVLLRTRRRLDAVAVTEWRRRTRTRTRNRTRTRGEHDEYLPPQGRINPTHGPSPRSNSPPPGGRIRPCEDGRVWR